MIIYGRHPVYEAIRGPRTVRRVWATKNAAREPWLMHARSTGTGLTETTGEDIEARSGTDGHQGMCAEVSDYVYADADVLLKLESPLLVVLDQVQDPQNLGAICRTAECAGANGVIIPERRTAAITPAVCKASAGAVEHLPVAIVRNLSDFLAAAKRVGLWCYGADAEGRVSYEKVDYAGGCVIVLGSEGSGLRPRVAKSCDALISLPLRGRVESLSVSAAAAVLLYTAAARR